MKIGIQISYDLKKRTGVEEYVYQLARHLPKVDGFRNHQFFLFAPHQTIPGLIPFISNEKRNITGYNRKNLKWPLKIGWTQIRLSLEMFKNCPDVLFVPAHTFPLIYPPLMHRWGVYPKKLIVTIQGLEFERVPEYYSYWQRKKLRFLTKRNAKRAEKIIVPSECTKNDLIELYKINPKKIFVVYHGINKKQKIKDKKHKLKTKKYVLHLGSGHKRKNVDGIIKAFEILKEKYKIPHKLLLAGPNHMRRYVGHSTSNIIMGYVNEDKKWQLLKGADVFVFPSFYEGFGIPALEAQAVGTPVVASNVSSLPEILGNSALLVDPKNSEEIAGAIYKIMKNSELREELVKKGYENVKRFSWKKCAEETLKIMTN